MSGIKKTFADLREHGRKGFIPFITAGDPDLGTTLKIMETLAGLGSTLIELGVPFTDPMADGPVIQASSKRALEGANPVNINDVLGLVSTFRKTSDVPVVIFGYLNPFLSYGIQKLADDARKAGVDGILITDVVDKEFDDLSSVFGSIGIDLISLVAPTTSDSRLRRILSTARGFVYAVSTRGVTGSGTRLDDAKQLVERIRSETTLPVAVGFGLSTHSDIEEVWKYADAAVVGSAIVRTIAEVSEDGDVPGAVGQFVEGLLDGRSR